MSALDLGTVLARVEMKVMTKLSNDKFDSTLLKIMEEYDKEGIFEIIKYNEGADGSMRRDIIVKMDDYLTVTNPHACIIKKIPYEGIYIDDVQQLSIEEFTNNLLLTLMRVV